MELVYIYHSGFALLGDGYTVIMDYYRDTEDKQAEAALRRLMNEQPEEPVAAPETQKSAERRRRLVEKRRGIC